MKRLFTVLVGVLLSATVLSAWAQSSLRVGVLAFRPKTQATAQWQPLATYLGAALGRPVELTAYGMPELDAAVAAHAVDVVFTTPSHFIALQHAHGLSAPVATQVTLYQGTELSVFGGVVFARADRATIATLADLTGQRIALTNTAFLGGYPMQAVELLDAGFALPQPDQLLATGMPQDKVVQAVLAGSADVGFVRTGVLEAMARERTLDLDQIKIINRQNRPDFPWLTSTRLYPDWPVALMPGVDARVARQLTVALLSLPPEHVAAAAAQIHGFTTAADYSAVDAVLRRLQMPPYETSGALNLRDVWAQHGEVVASVLGVLTLVLAGGGAWLVRQNRLVRLSRTRHREQSNHISEIIWGTNAGTWEWDVSTGIVVVNARWAETLGFTLKEWGPMTIERWMERTHPDDLATSTVMVEQCFSRAAKDYHCDVRMRHKNGEWVWVMNRGRVVQWTLDGKPQRMVGTQLDIADRKRAELREQHHNRVLKMLAAKSDLGDVLASIARGVQSTQASARCCIFLLEPDTKTLRLGAAPDLPDFFLQGLSNLGGGQDICPCAQAALNAVTVVVSDITNDPACAAMAELARRAKLRACWSQPIFSSMGTVLGSFSIYLRQTASPTPEDLQMLQDEARLCALVIEKTADQSRLQLAASVFSHAREGIIITDAKGNMIDVNETFCYITGYSRDEVLGKNPSMLQSGRQGPEFYSAMWQTMQREGHWSGEMWNRRKDGSVYAELITISAVHDAQGRAQNYVALFTDVTNIKEHQNQLEHIAHYDALTSLPNRVLLADRMRQSMAQSQRRNLSLAVVYLDLDGFKAVNDTHGHNVGDQLLIAVAQRMQEALRDGDTLARIGGDEFVAVLGDLEHPHDCEPVLARLLSAASSPVTVTGNQLQVSASIGVTLYPQDAADADQLMRHADHAMYQAKQAGKNRYHLFDPSQDAAAKIQRLSIERIRSALHANEMVLHYQPKVNMKTGAVVGAEALIRWQHPERGLLQPSAFLPIIENQDVSVELDEWVIGAALAQMAQWLSQGLSLPVSVNVGARQLQQANFAERLGCLLAAHPTVSPAHLELEVLETSALADITQVSAIMQGCRALGVHFALDDFGTGYSSLTYLKHLPAELLKIDQSFVRDMLDDPDDLAIVEGVIGLATAFRRKAIAEGVETVAHGELLLTLGCALGQGYGIARPMPAADVPTWVNTWRPAPVWAAWRERALNRDDLTVVFSEVGHRHWLRLLEAYFAGQIGHPPTLGEGECHFGRWQASEGESRFGHLAPFKEATALHHRIHTMAQALVGHFSAGRVAQAQDGLAELLPLNDELNRTLRNLLYGSGIAASA